MKKKIEIILVLIVLLCLWHNDSYATDNTNTSTQEIMNAQKSSLNINGFIQAANQYTSDVFGGTDYHHLLDAAIKGEIDNKALGNSILDKLGKETISSIRTISLIIIVIVIHSIIKSISEGLENKSVAQITYYVQYILIATLIMTNFADIITMVKESVNQLVQLANLLVPILMTLILTTGSIASANMLQPILLFLITFIGNFINAIIIPILLVSTAIGILSKISDRIPLDKLSKFLKSSIIWVLGVVLTLFVSLVSIEGSLSSSVDGITAKTAKAAVSNFIPVVGKILGDAVDTVIGCSGILKNALGMVGVIVIIGIVSLPIIKLTVLMSIYYLTAAICQPIADTKIVKLIEQMGDTFKLLLAIITSIAVMLIIGVTLVVKISNSGLMYR